MSPNHIPPLLLICFSLNVGTSLQCPLVSLSTTVPETGLQGHKGAQEMSREDRGGSGLLFPI